MGRSRLVCVFTGFPKVQSIRLRRLFQPPVPHSVDFGTVADCELTGVLSVSAGAHELGVFGTRHCGGVRVSS